MESGLFPEMKTSNICWVLDTVRLWSWKRSIQEKILWVVLCALISAVYTNSTKMHRKNCWWRCCKKREKMFHHVVSWCRRLRLKRVVLHFVRCWPVVGGPFMNYVEIKMKEMLIEKLKSMDSGSDSRKMLQEIYQFSL